MFLMKTISHKHYKLKFSSVLRDSLEAHGTFITAPQTSYWAVCEKQSQTGKLSAESSGWGPWLIELDDAKLSDGLSAK